jgi:hypothetical protein
MPTYLKAGNHPALRPRLAMGVLCGALFGAIGGGLPGLAHKAHAQGPNVADAATLDYRLKPRLLAPNTWVIEGAVEDFSRANGCNIINTGFIAKRRWKKSILQLF